MDWTSSEIATLRSNASRGAAECALLLGRSIGSVKQAAHRHRISLRRSGSRSGTMLGQPRGIALKSRMREQLLDGTVDPELVAARMRMDTAAQLCPSCTFRPVRVRATGLCRVCHLAHLTARHREVLAEHESQRELWQARQQLKRSRDRAQAPT